MQRWFLFRCFSWKCCRLWCSSACLAVFHKVCFPAVWVETHASASFQICEQKLNCSFSPQISWSAFISIKSDSADERCLLWRREKRQISESVKCCCFFTSHNRCDASSALNVWNVWICVCTKFQVVSCWLAENSFILSANIRMNNANMDPYMKSLWWRLDQLCKVK